MPTHLMSVSGRLQPGWTALVAPPHRSRKTRPNLFAGTFVVPLMVTGPALRRSSKGLGTSHSRERMLVFGRAEGH
ncbi:hypothetical protein BFN03_15735 [Rhodococcus sp. WMMA185]|nr:hypothetical protein BFN03_15735 [Rhodococcus sp. WMMA185]